MRQKISWMILLGWMFVGCSAPPVPHFAVEVQQQTMLLGPSGIPSSAKALGFSKYGTHLIFSEYIQLDRWQRGYWFYWLNMTTNQLESKSFWPISAKTYKGCPYDDYAEYDASTDRGDDSYCWNQHVILSADRSKFLLAHRELREPEAGGAGVALYEHAVQFAGRMEETKQPEPKFIPLTISLFDGVFSPYWIGDSALISRFKRKDLNEFIWFVQYISTGNIVRVDSLTPEWEPILAGESHVFRFGNRESTLSVTKLEGSLIPFTDERLSSLGVVANRDENDRLVRVKMAVLPGDHVGIVAERYEDRPNDTLSWTELDENLAVVGKEKISLLPWEDRKTTAGIFSFSQSKNTLEEVLFDSVSNKVVILLKENAQGGTRRLIAVWDRRTHLLRSIPMDSHQSGLVHAVPIGSQGMMTIDETGVVYQWLRQTDDVWNRLYSISPAVAIQPPATVMLSPSKLWAFYDIASPNNGLVNFVGLGMVPFSSDQPPVKPQFLKSAIGKLPLFTASSRVSCYPYGVGEGCFLAVDQSGNLYVLRTGQNDTVDAVPREIGMGSLGYSSAVLASSQNGECVVGASLDVYCLNPKTGRYVKKTQWGGLNGDPTSLSWSKDGRWVFGADAKGGAVVWGVFTKEAIQWRLPESSSPVVGGVWVNDQVLATLQQDGTLTLWSIPDGAVLSSQVLGNQYEKATFVDTNEGTVGILMLKDRSSVQRVLIHQTE